MVTPADGFVQVAGAWYADMETGEADTPPAWVIRAARPETIVFPIDHELEVSVRDGVMIVGRDPRFYRRQA